MRRHPPYKFKAVVLIGYGTGHYYSCVHYSNDTSQYTPIAEAKAMAQERIVFKAVAVNNYRPR